MGFLFKAVTTNSASLASLAPILNVVFLGLFAVLLIIVVLSVISGRKKGKKTISRYEPVKPSNLIAQNGTTISAAGSAQGADTKKCVFCGKEIDSKNRFCSYCGKNQVKTYTQVFRRETVNTKEFINTINKWLADNPRIANVKCKMETNTGYGAIVNHYNLEEVKFEFELFNSINQNQYALTELSSLNLYTKSTDALIAEWKKVNPEAKVINTAGGTHSRSKNGSFTPNGVGATNKTQLFVFFKFDRNAY